MALAPGRLALSPARYRAITIVALLALMAIIVTGAAVRLTGSGMGCEDWPGCRSGQFIDVSSKHAAIEQINRMITGAVSVAVIGAVLGSVLRVPRRRDLIVLSLGLVAGLVGQIVLGGITVLVHLHPASVQGHMLLSLVIVAVAVVLVHRAGQPDDGELVRLVSPEIGRHLRVVAAITALAIVTGTVVTGAGPHAGDEDARRFGIAIATAARVHSGAVITAVAAMLLLAWRLRRRPVERAALGEWISGWVFVAALQGAVGYIQYLNEVPPLLVGAHVLLATVLWSMTVALTLRAAPLRQAAASSDVRGIALAPAVSG